ncbi:MAG: hypothetical protein M3015_08915 [Bacteroidota bacterium]|nr:hypothetical protein [Bacteroidota bacterium]
MKKVLLLIFVLTACGNPKEKIVEREKEVDVEIQKLDIKKSLLQHDELLFTHDNRDSLTTEWAQKKATQFYDSISNIEIKKAGLQAVYDSLEMELKKY